ncbi:hypothetical protein [Chryseobacterium aquaticum]|jgi:hypothetical protein|uniref:hypothetical protein n=1 Tax=Chryseobacterium aquaticum TaxID=452084 RepID=UPI003F706F12
MKYTLNNTIERFHQKENPEFLFFWGHTVKDEITKACFSQWFPFELRKRKHLQNSRTLYDGRKSEII